MIKVTLIYQPGRRLKRGSHTMATVAGSSTVYQWWRFTLDVRTIR